VKGEAVSKYDEIRARLKHGDVKIICLCGSTRFMDAFQKAVYDFTNEGAIVLSVGQSKYFSADHGGEAIGDDCAAMLDELHLRKIDLASRVHVLNVNGYVGPSTSAEVKYAIAHAKRITWLETDRIPPWVEKIDGDYYETKE